MKGYDKLLKSSGCRMQNHIRYYFILFIGLCGFASIPLFVESMLLAKLSPVYTYFIRFILTGIILLIGALIYFPWQAIFNKNYFKIFLMGLSIQSLGVYCFVIACQEIGTATASIIAYCFYIWIFLYELCIKKKKNSWGKVFGMLILALGSYGLCKFNVAHFNLKALLSLLIGTLSWAFIYLLLEQNRLNYYLSTLYLIAGMACGFAVLTMIEGSPLVQLELVSQHMLFFIGFSLISTLIPFLANLYVLPIIGAYKLAVFSNFEEVLALIVTGFFLQAPLLPMQIGAGIIIVLGVFIAIYFDKPRKVGA